MSEPVKHHFVPEVYLKRFSLNQIGDIFTLKINSEYPTKVNKQNKSQICYEKNRYKFDNLEIIKRLKIADPNIIEKSFFEYENEELEKLFDMIDFSQKMTQSEFKRLLTIILDIKRRNPSYSSRLKQIDSTSPTVTKNILEIKNQAIEYCKALGYNSNIVERIIKEIQEKHKDEDYLMNVYRSSIYDDQDVILEVLEELENWRAIVLFTDYETPFITSDNPGFTFNKEREIYNLDIKFIDTFAFPISPKSYLLLQKSNKKTLNIYKDISYYKADQKTIIMMNKASLTNTNKMIIGNSKEQLLITKDI